MFEGIDFSVLFGAFHALMMRLTCFGYQGCVRKAVLTLLCVFNNEMLGEEVSLCKCLTLLELERMKIRKAQRFDDYLVKVSRCFCLFQTCFLS